MKGVHLDKRLAPILANGDRVIPQFTTYLEAGCGFGGSCFPKDVKALVAHGQKLGSPMRILESVITVNEEQPRQVLLRLEQHFAELRGVQVTILGLAFKPGTDDIRESPAIPIMTELALKGAMIKAYDPIANENAKLFFKEFDIKFCSSLEEAVSNTKAILILTSWKEFQSIPKLIQYQDPQPLVVDGRRILDKKSIIKYEGIGI
jgi:UDPglucose 6-dehydrogenase